MTSNPDIDSLIRDDINQTLALAIDKAALHGTGSPQPTGIANTAGINTVALAANGQALGNATAYPALVSLETAIATNNADTMTMGYLMNAAHRSALKTVTKFGAAGETDTVYMNGLANSYRALVSNQIATNLTTGTATTQTSCLFFGDFSQLIIAQFNNGTTDMVVDSFSAAQNGIVKIICRRWVNCAVRHPESFAVPGGIL